MGQECVLWQSESRLDFTSHPGLGTRTILLWPRVVIRHTYVHVDGKCSWPGTVKEGEREVRMNGRVVKFDHSGRVTESAQHNTTETTFRAAREIL